MKIHVITVGGKLTPGDGVHIHWCDARGGRTNAGYYIQEGDNHAKVAKSLADSVNIYFLGAFFKVTQEKNKVVIVADGHPDGEIVTEVTGKKTETLTMTDGFGALTSDK